MIVFEAVSFASAALALLFAIRAHRRTAVRINCVVIWMICGMVACGHLAQAAMLYKPPADRIGMALTTAIVIALQTTAVWMLSRDMPDNGKHK